MRNFFIGLSKLKTEELIQILHDCEELLGLVTAEEYSQMIERSKRYVFNLIHDNKVVSIKLKGRYYVVVNDNLNE